MGFMCFIELLPCLEFNDNSSFNQDIGYIFSYRIFVINYFDWNLTLCFKALFF